MSWSASSNTSYPYPAPGSVIPMPPHPLDSSSETKAAAAAAAAAATSSSSSMSPQSASGSGSGSDNHGRRQDSVSSTSNSTSNPNSNNTPPEATRDRVTVPSACVQCRSKHLKCDGLTPCTRCAANSFDCLYVKSRRGFKGPRRNAAQAQNNKAVSLPAQPTVTAIPACPLVRPGGGSSTARISPTVANGLVPNADNRLQVLNNVDLPQFDIGKELSSFESKGVSAGMDLRERCIEAFFYHFYPAHPFMFPRTTFMALRKKRSLDCLEAAMRYVGSFYVEEAPTIALGLEAERLAYHMDTPKDAYKVQALLISAIGLDGYTYQEKALDILIDAQNLALELGMNKRDFASLNGNGSSTVEESWRRTWWELYIIDGMIAGVHQKSSFRLNEIYADVALPCEEKEYLSGKIPSPHTMQDFDEESFMGSEMSYSSFTYRITAIRNLGRVLASPARQMLIADEPAIDRVDAHLVNWRLHLPESKRTAITKDGQLDEMLFQAHMISEATTILLHREHSQLDSSVAQNVTSCAPHKSIAPGPSYNIHAVKTVQAAQDISKLIMLPVSLAKHTHFFTCVVTLASIVHLSCWSVLLPLIHDDDLKQQLRLNTGALKSLWQVWPSAGKAFGQVKGVAQEIYASKKQAAAIGFGDWNTFNEEEVMRSMIEDHIIMEELQLL